MVAQQKLPQVLQLTPSGEITFQGPFEHVVTSYLELKNPTDQRVCFKVKTTAPRRYCVRPNSGIVEPDGKIKIAIMLQPMDADTQSERNKHKFMVQSTIITGDKSSQQADEIWQNATPEEIMDSKLRCVFQVPGQHQDISPNKKDADSVPDVASKQNIISPSTTTATTTTSIQQQQAEQIARSNRASGDARPNLVEPTTSTPVISRVSSSTSKPTSSTPASSGTPAANQIHKRSTDAGEHRLADKSMASSHNLTSSFLHPMSDDYKIVLVSLAMLILGVILGKYII